MQQPASSHEGSKASEEPPVLPAGAPAPSRAPGALVFWSIAFLCSAIVFTPGLTASLQPPRGAIFDFFKEWAAVRNWQSNMPLYTPQRTAIRRHLGQDLATEDGFFDPYNTHPPTASLFAIPFGRLPYRTAHFAWNVASLALLAVSLVWIARELDVRIDGTVLLAAATVLLASDPLRQSLIQGQPNLLLGFLLVAAWRADRQGRAWLSGVWLAVAATVKLYPAWLFLYALVRRDWRTLAGGLVGGLAITAVTAGVFGADAYRDYVQTVLPQLRTVTNNWGNSSLLAFWERLFGDPVATVAPVMPSPAALKTCVGISWLAVTVLTVWCVRTARSQRDRDAAFSVVILSMLLMSPTTWHHYFVLTAIPVCLALVLSRPGSWQRIGTWTALFALTIAPRLIWALLIPGTLSEMDVAGPDAPGTAADHAGAAAHADTAPPVPAARVATAWQSLTALSFQMYAVFLLTGVLLRLCSRTAVHSSPPERNAPPRGSSLS